MRKKELRERLECYHELFSCELNGFKRSSMIVPVNGGVKGMLSYTTAERERMETILTRAQVKHAWTATNKLIVYER